LKLLQSEGRNHGQHGKPPNRHETHDYTVEGPVMLFLTTTISEEELLSRCMVLTVGEAVSKPALSIDSAPA
jgi:hypothetical protein